MRRLTVIAVVLVLTAGCVERRMTLSTSPEGAIAYYNGKAVGRTPVTFHFTHYQPARLTFEKDGHETFRVVQELEVPAWQRYPLDFFAENLVAGEIRDQRTFNYPLSPQRMVPSEELLQRGEDLRRGVRPAGVRPPS